MTRGLLMGAFLALCACATAEEAYPRPELLIEPGTLAKPEEAKRFVVLDARDHEKYVKGHIPGAHWVDHAAWSKAFGEGKDADGWSKRIGELGIGPDTRVVVYDDNHGKEAARIWWILKYWSVEDARLLNGGWAGWEKGGHPVEKSEPALVSAKFTAKAKVTRL